MAKTGCGNCAHKSTDESLEKSYTRIDMQLADTRHNRDMKRMTILLIVILCMWFATIGSFVWYVSQYDYVGYDISQDVGDGNANYIGGNGDINNGETKNQNQDTQTQKP